MDAINIEAPGKTDFTELEKEYLSSAQIIRFIESLDVSSEAKLIMAKVADITFVCGETMLKFGKKIFEIVIMLSQKFPNMFIGMIISALLVLVIAQLPFVGTILSQLFGSLIMALGLSAGAIQDFKDNVFARKIGEATAMFAPLKEAKAT